MYIQNDKHKLLSDFHRVFAIGIQQTSISIHSNRLTSSTLLKKYYPFHSVSLFSNAATNIPTWTTIDPPTKRHLSCVSLVETMVAACLDAYCLNPPPVSFKLPESPLFYVSTPCADPGNVVMGAGVKNVFTTLCLVPTFSRGPTFSWGGAQLLIPILL